MHDAFGVEHTVAKADSNKPSVGRQLTGIIPGGVAGAGAGFAGAIGLSHARHNKHYIRDYRQASMAAKERYPKESRGLRVLEAKHIYNQATNVKDLKNLKVMAAAGALGGALAGGAIVTRRHQKRKFGTNMSKNWEGIEMYDAFGVERTDISKGLPSALRGGKRIAGPGADIIGRTMQGSNWSGKQAAKQIAMQRTRSPGYRQGQAGGFIKQGRDQKRVRFQREQWMGTDPATRQMVDTRALRNADKGGFKGQFNAPPAAARINPALQARLAARKGS